MSVIALGDVPNDATLYFHFNTHKADGTLFTLAGSPVLSIYKREGTVESTTGVTLTVDFDGRTGFHRVELILTDGFYAVNQDYSVVITTGTVDGVSVVGTVVARFTIEHSNQDVTSWGGNTVTGDGDWSELQDAVDTISAFLASLNVSGGIIESNLKQINDDSVAGNLATLTLKQLDIQSDANLDAVIIKGSGSGSGVAVEGGATGDGITTIGGITSGHGFSIRAGAEGNGHGLNIEGGGDNDNHGIRVVSLSSTIGDAIYAKSFSTNGGKGINAIGSAAEPGIAATGGATGNGVEIDGGATSGNGLLVQANAGNGKGAYLKGHGVGEGMIAEGGVNGVGFRGKAGTGGGGAGIMGQAFTGGPGIFGNGGIGIKGQATGTGEAGLELVKGAGGKDIDADEIDDIKVVTDLIPDSGAMTSIAQETTVDAVQSTVDDIEIDTQDLQTQIGTAGAGLSDLGGMSTGMKAEVNDEVLDVLTVDTHAEVGQETPSATQSILKMVQFLFKSWRNKKDNDGSTTQLYSDAGSVVDQKQSTSDVGGTSTKTEWTSGP